MENITNRAYGRMVDRKTGQGIHGLRIEAWDKEKQWGAAVTDRRGRFKIPLRRRYFRDYAPDSSPDLFFKIYRGRELIRSTEDSVLWNTSTDTEVTVEIEMPPLRRVGKDRVSARQVVRAVDFIQLSDFLSVWNEAQDRTSTMFGFVRDMVTNTIKEMDVSPLRPGTFKIRDVINQDVDSARTRLEAQEIEINEIRPYKPGMNIESISSITPLLSSLKKGQMIDIFEENGQVRGYSVVKKKPPSEIDLTDSVKRQKAEIENLSKQLRFTKQESVKKDKQIAELKQGIESLRASQNKIEKKVKPETLAKLTREIKKLQEFKEKMEKVQKKEP